MRGRRKGTRMLNAIILRLLVHTPRGAPCTPRIVYTACLCDVVRQLRYVRGVTAQLQNSFQLSLDLQYRYSTMTINKQPTSKT